MTIQITNGIELLKKNNIHISIEKPQYDQERFEGVKFKKELEFDNLSFDIEGEVIFKFDEDVDEIYGREVNIETFEIEKITIYDNCGDDYLIPESFYSEIKSTIQIN